MSDGGSKSVTPPTEEVDLEREARPSPTCPALPPARLSTPLTEKAFGNTNTLESKPSFPARRPAYPPRAPHRPACDHVACHGYVDVVRWPVS